MVSSYSCPIQYSRSWMHLNRNEIPKKSPCTRLNLTPRYWASNIYISLDQAIIKSQQNVIVIREWRGKYTMSSQPWWFVTNLPEISKDIHILKNLTTIIVYLESCCTSGTTLPSIRFKQYFIIVLLTCNLTIPDDLWALVCDKSDSLYYLFYFLVRLALLSSIYFFLDLFAPAAFLPSLTLNLRNNLRSVMRSWFESGDISVSWPERVFLSDQLAQHFWDPRVPLRWNFEGTLALSLTVSLSTD